MQALFPSKIITTTVYSLIPELFGNEKSIEEITAGNGITKVFIATPAQNTIYKDNMPVFIYRKYTGIGQKTYKSVITSLCTISKIVEIKRNNLPSVSFEEFVALAGNKTVYPKDELKKIFQSKRNIFIIELVYNAYFGKGHNVNHATLNNNGLFKTHPYQIVYNRKEFKKILELGGKNVQNIVIH